VKKVAKRLTLRRETVLALEQESLAPVVGGATTPVTICATSCPSKCPRTTC
jgi:hypothetical protein